MAHPGGSAQKKSAAARKSLGITSAPVAPAPVQSAPSFNLTPSAEQNRQAFATPSAPPLGTAPQAPPTPALPSNIPQAPPSPAQPQAPQQGSPFKVPTGSVGPNGPIFDVFAADGTPITDPNDPRLNGLNIPDLPTGQAPEDFQSQFKPAEEQVPPDQPIVSDTKEIGVDAKKAIDDIEKGLADIGITPPDFTEIDKFVQEQKDLLEERQKQLEQRLREERTRIASQFDVDKGELTREQQREMDQANGRARIGGFFTSMERDKILELQRDHRLERMQLSNNREVALRKAKEAFEDNDFKFALAQIELAKEAEREMEDRKRRYFDDVIKAQKFFKELNAPATEATEANQNQMLSWVQAAPEAFEDISPSDVMSGRVTYAEMLTRWVDSDAYALEQRGERAEVARAERLAADGGDTSITAPVSPGFFSSDIETDARDNLVAYREQGRPDIEIRSLLRDLFSEQEISDSALDKLVGTVDEEDNVVPSAEETADSWLGALIEGPSEEQLSRRPAGLINNIIGLFK